MEGYINVLDGSRPMLFFVFRDINIVYSNKGRSINQEFNTASTLYKEQLVENRKARSVDVVEVIWKEMHMK
jgi:hypothetical protein